MIALAVVQTKDLLNAVKLSSSYCLPDCTPAPWARNIYLVSEKGGAYVFARNFFTGVATYLPVEVSGVPSPEKRAAMIHGGLADRIIAWLSDSQRSEQVILAWDKEYMEIRDPKTRGQSGRFSRRWLTWDVHTAEPEILFFCHNVAKLTQGQSDFLGHEANWNTLYHLARQAGNERDVILLMCSHPQRGLWASLWTMTQQIKQPVLVSSTMLATRCCPVHPRWIGSFPAMGTVQVYPAPGGWMFVQDRIVLGVTRRIWSGQETPAWQRWELANVSWDYVHYVVRGEAKVSRVTELLSRWQIRTAEQHMQSIFKQCLAARGIAEEADWVLHTRIEVAPDGLSPVLVPGDKQWQPVDRGRKKRKDRTVEDCLSFALNIALHEVLYDYLASQYGLPYVPEAVGE